MKVRQPRDSRLTSNGGVAAIAPFWGRLALLTVLTVPIAAYAADPAATPTSAVAAGTPWNTPSLATTIEAIPKNLPRATAPDLAAAIDAALAAERACAAKNAKISILIADAAGKPVVLLSGDGAGYRSQLIAQTKINIVVRYGKASGDVEIDAKTKPELAAAAAADPEIGMLRAGGFPIYRAGRLIGIVGVSGASLASGDLGLDEVCAKVAVAKLESR